MQDTINNNRDAFSDFVRQKLENHDLPVDPTSWQEIEARLKSKKRIIPFWFWLSGGAAVAFLAIILTLHPLSESNSRTSNATKTTAQQTLAHNNSTTKENSQIVNKTREDLKRTNANKASTDLVQSNTTKTATLNMLAQSTTTTAKNSQMAVKTLKGSMHSEANNALSEQGQSIPPEVNASTQLAVIDSIYEKKSLETVTEQNLNTEKDIADKSTANGDTIPGNKLMNPTSLVEETSKKPTVKTKNKNGWLLAAAFSSHGGVPAGNDKYNLATGNNNIVTAFTGSTPIMTPNDFSNIIYTPPVSVGLVLRKNINKFIGVESGLVYTYLLTTFENSVTQRNDAKLHLHYIGIPLNLVAQLWNKPNWEIYVSGGGMIEKGIESVYVQHQYGGSQPIKTTVISKINGIQWSTTGAIGTTYKIYRNIGIYFEPKIAYYFDDNQPISARTEYRVVIGLTAGVRFQFK